MPTASGLESLVPTQEWCAEYNRLGGKQGVSVFGWMRYFYENFHEPDDWSDWRLVERARFESSFLYQSATTEFLDAPTCGELGEMEDMRSGKSLRNQTWWAMTPGAEKVINRQPNELTARAQLVLARLKEKEG